MVVIPQRGDFGAAFAKHFGLKDVFSVTLNYQGARPFSVDISMALNPSDLEAIRALMSARAPEPEQEIVSAHFDPPATYADLARFAG